MRRREVLAVLAGGVTSASRAHAQPPAIPVIGFLSSGQPKSSRICLTHSAKA
ncbi:MAG: hypothetical protein K0R61_2081 [Microvirga sp.]|nr:hypothetical protein [Microvirga sp.]MDF2971631.1 hypothetical protein [Microvirga sp.]